VNLSKKTLEVINVLLPMLRGKGKPRLFLSQYCNICEFCDKCHEEATETDSLSLLKGITEREVERQNNKGIFTVTQYSYTYRPRKRRAKHESPIRKHQWALNALAVRTDTVYVEKVPELPLANTNLYLDIEGIPDRDFYYLVGVIVTKRQEREEHVFWADDESSEGNLWRSFVTLIKRFDDFVIFHYGKYDAHALIQLCQRYGGSQSLQDLLTSTAYNVLSAIYGHIYFPCYGNDLKSVASCLGFRWRDPNSTGVKSIAQRLAWERSRCSEPRDWLVRYNKDDCRALHLVTNVIHGLCRNNQIRRGGMCKSVVHADTLKNSKEYELIKNRSFFPELEIINRCSYFDYQRDRVYVRTDTNLKKRMRRAVAKSHSSRPIDKTTTLEPPVRCAYCKATNLVHHARLETVVEDLKFSRKGVKRWNVKYRSYRYMCNT